MRKAKTDFDFNGKKVETENVIPTQISDLTDGQQTLNAISQNAQDIDTIENTLPNLASQNYVDQKFNGAAKAISFDSYATMITAFNALADDVYVSGQNINILTLEVPDLWVYEVDSTRIPYTYVDDATFINELSTNGYVQVGFYKLAALETQKVDLTNYQEKLTPTNVPSGTIEEPIGFDNLGNIVRGASGGNLYQYKCIFNLNNGGDIFYNYIFTLVFLSTTQLDLSTKQKVYDYINTPNATIRPILVYYSNQNTTQSSSIKMPYNIYITGGAGHSLHVKYYDIDLVNNTILASSTSYSLTSNVFNYSYIETIL